MNELVNLIFLCITQAHYNDPEKDPQYILYPMLKSIYTSLHAEEESIAQQSQANNDLIEKAKSTGKLIEWEKQSADVAIPNILDWLDGNIIKNVNSIFTMQALFKQNESDFMHCTYRLFSLLMSKLEAQQDMTINDLYELFKERMNAELTKINKERLISDGVPKQILDNILFEMYGQKIEHSNQEIMNLPIDLNLMLAFIERELQSKNRTKHTIKTTDFSSASAPLYIRMHLSDDDSSINIRMLNMVALNYVIEQIQNNHKIITSQAQLKQTKLIDWEDDRNLIILKILSKLGTLSQNTIKDLLQKMQSKEEQERLEFCNELDAKLGILTKAMSEGIAASLIIESEDFLKPFPRKIQKAEVEEFIQFVTTTSATNDVINFAEDIIDWSIKLKQDNSLSINEFWRNPNEHFKILLYLTCRLKMALIIKMFKKSCDMDSNTIDLENFVPIIKLAELSESAVQLLDCCEEEKNSIIKGMHFQMLKAIFQGIVLKSEGLNTVHQTQERCSTYIANIRKPKAKPLQGSLKNLLKSFGIGRSEVQQLIIFNSLSEFEMTESNVQTFEEKLTYLEEIINDNCANVTELQKHCLHSQGTLDLTVVKEGIDDLLSNIKNYVHTIIQTHR